MRRLRKIHDAAACSIGVPWMPLPSTEPRSWLSGSRPSRRSLRRSWSKSNPSAGHAVLPAIADHPRVRAVYHPPGAVGLADPNRFHKQVIRLAGSGFNASRSGKKSRQQRRFISKGDVDPWLYQAALIASDHNDAFRRVYNRMRESRQESAGSRPRPEPFRPRPGGWPDHAKEPYAVQPFLCGLQPRIVPP